MIKFDKVTKRFPLGNVALDNVSFEIADDEMVFLVGPSGAGKTTIIKLILHELTASSGSVLVGDFDVSDKNFHDTITLRQNCGVVFQDFKILPDKNVFENVALSQKVIGIPDREIRSQVKAVLKLVGLTDKEKVFPVQLSAGELQRVAIARAIVGDRKIIVADEPTGNLDPKTAWDIMKIFRKLEGKKTILIATHNTDIVNSYQRRVLVMKNGRLVKDHREGGYEL